MKTLMIVVLGVLALGVSLPAQDNMLLNDDFSDGILQGWQYFVSGWFESDGVLHGTNTSANVRSEIVYVNGYGWTDYAAEADVTLLSGYMPADVELNIRYLTENRRCYCSLLQGQPDASVGWGQYLVLSAPFDAYEANVTYVYQPFNYTLNTTYRLRATAKGQTVTCEVQGYPESKLTITDPRIPASGTIALRNTHIPADFDNVTVHKIQKTPKELLTELIDTVNAINLQQGIENSLDRKLENAQMALDDLNNSNNQSTIGLLNAFVQEVNAQRDNKIPTSDADALTALALQIIAVLQNPI